METKIEREREREIEKNLKEENWVESRNHRKLWKRENGDGRETGRYIGSTRLRR